MKPIVDCCLTFGFLVPVIDAFDKRLTFILHCEVDDARGAAVCGGDCSRVKVVGSLSATERQFHMRVWIDATRDNKLTAGINHAVDFYFELRPDYRYKFIFDQDVGFVIVSGGDDATALN